MSNKPSQTVRFSRPNRIQYAFQDICLEELISPTHEVRTIWDYVCGLDLSPFCEEYKAVDGNAGRRPVPPEILLTLWLYATIEGITSARHLAERCDRDAVYMWICGGVGVNRTLLNSFRVSHQSALEDVMVRTIAVLHHHKLIDMKRVSQDGMRVRANAGKSSFRKKDSLESLLREAKEKVDKVLSSDDDDNDESSNQESSARKRASEERHTRLQKALQEHEELAKQKEKRKKGEGEQARTSTTDPEARVMKMADGGYRPALNVQAIVSNGSRLILGIDVSNEGTDSGKMGPMLDYVEQTYGDRPQELLADGGYNSKSDVTAVEQGGTSLYAPVRRSRKENKSPYDRHRGDSAEVFQWRQRMKSQEAQDIYNQRSSTAEFPFARFRNQGLQRLPVRTVAKAKSVAYLHAIVHNLRQIIHLGWSELLTTS